MNPSLWCIPAVQNPLSVFLLYISSYKSHIRLDLLPRLLQFNAADMKTSFHCSAGYGPGGFIHTEARAFDPGALADFRVKC